MAKKDGGLIFVLQSIVIRRRGDTISDGDFEKAYKNPDKKIEGIYRKFEDAMEAMRSMVPENFPMVMGDTVMDICKNTGLRSIVVRENITDYANICHGILLTVKSYALR